MSQPGDPHTDGPAILSSVALGKLPERSRSTSSHGSKISPTRSPPRSLASAHSHHASSRTPRDNGSHSQNNLGPATATQPPVLPDANGNITSNVAEEGQTGPNEPPVPPKPNGNITSDVAEEGETGPPSPKGSRRNSKRKKRKDLFQWLFGTSKPKFDVEATTYKRERTSSQAHHNTNDDTASGVPPNPAPRQHKSEDLKVELREAKKTKKKTRYLCYWEFVFIVCFFSASLFNFVAALSFPFLFNYYPMVTTVLNQSRFNGTLNGIRSVQDISSFGLGIWGSIYHDEYHSEGTTLSNTAAYEIIATVGNTSHTLVSKGASSIMMVQVAAGISSFLTVYHSFWTTSISWTVPAMASTVLSIVANYYSARFIKNDMQVLGEGVKTQKGPGFNLICLALALLTTGCLFQMLYIFEKKRERMARQWAKADREKKKMEKHTLVEVV